MTISQAVDWWATQAGGVTGVSVATGTPDENIGTNGITFMAFASSGVLTSEAALQYRDLHTIRGLLIMPRGNLASAIAAMRDLPVTVANLVRADPTMGGYVDTYDQITYTFAPVLDWQGVQAIGYVIDVSGVKIRPTA